MPNNHQTLFQQGKEGRTYTWTNKAPVGFQLLHSLVFAESNFFHTEWTDDRRLPDNIPPKILSYYVTQVPTVNCRHHFEPPTTIREYVSSKKHSTHSCFAMNWLQIKHPFWVEINCNDPVTDTVMCISPQTVQHGEILDQVCGRKQILLTKTECVSITDSDSSKQIPGWRWREVFKSYLKLHLWHFESPLDISSKLQIGWHSPSTVATVAASMPSIFLCTHAGYFISRVGLFDGDRDCGDESDEDWIHLSPNNMSTTSFLQSSCPLNMFTDTNGMCQTFTDLTLQGHGTTVARTQAPETKQLEWKRSCSDRHNLSESFFFYNQCFYKRDKMGKLAFCSNGRHLANCKSYNCHGKFKCLLFYCISLSAICDGYWDCPSGADENICGEFKCTGHFKCKLSSQCIHILDVCDNKTDCLYGDDEAMCNLPQCVGFQCVCLNFAITCSKSPFLESSSPAVLMLLSTFVFVHISTSLTKHPWKLLSFRRKKCLLALPQNNISEVCCTEYSATGLEQVVFLNLAHNKISKVLEACFKFMSNLTVLLLGSNKISELEVHCFAFLPSLQYVDLANNYLHTIDNVLFDMQNSLKVLNISQVKSFNRIHVAAFSNMNGALFLQTTDYHVCCAASATLCSTHNPWPGNCHSILYTMYFSNVSLAVTILLILSCALSILVNNVLGDQGEIKKQKESGFWLTTFVFFTSCFLYSSSFIPLLVFDRVYGIDFIEKELSTRNNAFCILIAPSRLFFKTAATTTLVFISISRSAVTGNPLSTRFKCVYFVKKCLVNKFLGLLMAFVSFTCTQAVYPGYQLLQMPLCSFLIILKQTELSLVIALFVSTVHICSAVMIVVSSVVMVVSVCQSGVDGSYMQVGKNKMQKKTVAVNAAVLIVHTVSTYSAYVTTVVVFMWRAAMVPVFWTTLVVMPLSFSVHLVLLSVKKTQALWRDLVKIEKHQ